ncbi:MAG TPA: hypothetical protein VLL54_15890 [Pyrinomonadaceae bacterium]|nr:hypothetical protein [Pyrinomonadaceae bacterium]
MCKTTLTKSLFVLIASLLISLGVPCAAQETPKDLAQQDWRQLYDNRLRGSDSDCRPAAGAKDRGARICKGPEGYSLLLKGAELKPEVYLIAPDERRYQLQYWDTRDPNLQQLRDLVFWTVLTGPPKSISISFTVQVTPKQDYSSFGTYEIIVRVNPGPVCVVTSIKDGLGSPEARIEAASPDGCLDVNQLEKRDWFLTADRLAREGKPEPARRALKGVKEPSQRFIVYHDMASAQFKAGHPEVARRILLGARAEALQDHFRDNLAFTLIHVVGGLTEAGFYKEAKSDIKLFSEYDQLRMYLMVANIQGERKDFRAATATFQETLSWDRQKHPRGDGNRFEIGSAQANMGLVDEARKTAATIQDPENRKGLERIISELHPRP